MKKTHFFRLPAFVLACFMALSAYAQSDTITVVYVKDVEQSLLVTSVENPAEYPGGVSALKDFLRDNLRYPEKATKKGLEARVIVQFWIETDGTVSRVAVLSDPNPIFDKEAVRLIRSMPKWKPATQRGNPVALRYTLPVDFKPTPDNPKGKKAKSARR